MASIIKKVKKIKQIIKTQKKKTSKNKESLSSKLLVGSSRLSLDDPQNNVFDDEVYDELILPDENITNNEITTYEKSW